MWSRNLNKSYSYCALFVKIVLHVVYLCVVLRVLCFPHVEHCVYHASLLNLCYMYVCGA